jgi:photosystem II stability/assembly factor-like uncharacterized protein
MSHNDADNNVRNLVRLAGDDLPTATQGVVRSAVTDALQGVPPAAVATPHSTDGRSQRRVRYVVIAAAAAVLVVVGLMVLPEETHRGVISPVTDVTTTEPVPESTPPPDTEAPATVVVPPTTAASPDSTLASDSTAVSTSTEPTSLPKPPAAAMPISLPPYSTAGPDSVDWVTALDGWVKVFTEAADATVPLLHTVDGGSTWVVIPTSVPMPDNTATVRFADDRHGWIISASALHSTHDGGSTWSAVTLGDGSWQAMVVETSGPMVHVLAASANGTGSTMFVSPIDRDAFVQSSLLIRFGAGAADEAQLAIDGDRGWVTYGDRGLIGAARFDGAQWVDWITPCRTAGPTSGDDARLSVGEHGFGAGRLVVGCSTNGFYGPPYDTRFFASDDGGQTFIAIPFPTRQTETSQRILDIWLPGDGSIVVVHARQDGSISIVRTSDSGQDWSTVGEFRIDQIVVGSFEIGDAGFGLLINTPSAIASYDGGLTWSDVPIGTITS